MKTVLFIDDDQSTLMIVSKMLSFYGYKGLGFKNPNEALYYLESHSVDAILTDYKMPEMNGVELAKKVQQIANSTPIIMLTKTDDIKTMQTASMMGVFDFLVKPVDPDELNSTLEKAMDFVELGQQTEEQIKSEKNRFYNRKSKNLLSSKSQNDIKVRTIELKVDFEKIKEIIGGNPNDLSELLDLFLNALDRRIKDLNKIIQNEDIEDLKSCLHTLYGTSSSLFINQFTAQIENLNRQVSLNIFPKSSQIKELINSSNKIINQINEYQKVSSFKQAK